MLVTALPPRAVARPSAAFVSRRYVHKTASSEVLLTGLSPAGADRFHLTARWPSEHSFYGPKGGFHDPMLIAESVRQAVPLLSHVAYGVPFGHRQSWSSFSYEVDPVALTFTGAGAHLDLHVTCSEVVRRGGRLASLRMQVDLFVDGRPLGVAESRFCDLAPAVYRRLRGPYADAAQAARHAVPLAPPVEPARVARTRPADVVLSPTGSPLRTHLRTVLSHPILFDHPVDHAPGMLLLEAARQTAHATVHPRPMLATGLDAVFTRYVEFDAPCELDHVPPAPSGNGPALVRVQATQNGTSAFAATVAMTPALP
ncbi:ScbA/BarX family gamma-butyrolactone biosynthesis protein [Streptomyces sp. NPDC004542]|uniref:ScbA/BarX family gamma-butyrolactone biosynthesis protein n=1 Tax=Streptomyces sp. NPDC004542 TaxID=3154281 RepID=UPI0033AE772C